MKNEYNDSKNKSKEHLLGITCNICMDLYSQDKKPLILVCGHTFCEICLQKLFDTSNEIQCCFCKIVTKLDRFDDMIVNYSLLSISEMKFFDKQKEPIKSLFCKCEETNKIEKSEILLQCLDCNSIVCPNCIGDSNEISIHKNHKLTNLSDFISKEADSLTDSLKSYRDLANKYKILSKKIEKSELEKIVRIEKDKITNFFYELKTLIDKNQEIMINMLDKLLKDSYKELESLKREINFFNSDSNRYCSIIEELNNYKKLPSKQKTKILNIYNINSTLEEIKEFNKEVICKLENIVTVEEFYQKFSNLAKNCELYKNKMFNFHLLINEKGKRLLEKGYEKNVRFFKRNI